MQDSSNFKILLLLLVLLPLPASAADKSWIEVRSPHFRVLSDGTERDARSVAGRFEQMRMTFAAALPGLRLDVPVPLLILAPKNEDSIRKLLPERWKQKGVKPGGFFATGLEKSFAVVRLDVSNQVVYHEYTHFVLNANFRWLPLWLNEGLAEFFGNTQFEGDKIYLGAPNIRAEYTRGKPLIPLERLIDITAGSSEYRDADKVQMFYSESWGLVHFLVGTKRLQQFLTLIEKGGEQRQAFREAIGDFKEIEEQLKRYLDRSSLDVFAFNNPSRIMEDTFSAGQLKSAQSNAELGTVQVWLHENTAAHPRLEQALKDDPRSGLAAEAMGFLKFAEGRDQEARALFQRAFEEDAKLYLSAYYRAMLSPAAQPDIALNHVLELNREFAPAYVQIAAAYIREKKFENALVPALKAQQLWPSKGSYHILIGNILHALGRDSEAAAVARYVAERWQEINHDEAVELWQKLPPELQKGADLTKASSLSGTRMISGKVTSVTCRDRDQTMRIVIDGKPLTFRVQDETSIGLSDTVWYGPDHFSRCHHLDGLQVVIQYVPATASGITGDVTRFDIYPNFE